MIVRKLGKGGVRHAEDSSASLSWQFFVSGPVDDASVLHAVGDDDVGMPHIGDAIDDPAYAGLVVVGVAPEWVSTLTNGDQQWFVDVDYRAASFAPGTDGGAGVPAVRYRWTSRIERVQTSVNCDGKPLLNAAGDPPEGGSEGYEITKILTVYQRVSAFDVLKQNSVLGKVNSKKIKVFGYDVEKRQMLCTMYEPTEDQILGKAGVVTVQHVYEFRGGFMPHDHRFANVGFNGWYNEGDAKKRSQFYSTARDANDPVDVPVFLTTDGQPIYGGSFVTKVGAEKREATSNPNIASIRKGGEGDTGWMTFRYPEGEATYSTAYADRHFEHDFSEELPGIFAETT